MKRLFALILSLALFYAALGYLALTVQSVDYHDGTYHPIPRGRHFLTSVVAATAGFGVLLYRRCLRPGAAPRRDKTDSAGGPAKPEGT
ncbi:MAG: hypothetical protein JWO31_3004 [Phycisphaerales bacterium]|nr:hypothetical protein [Phycisphaerales bacterium]